MGFLFYFIFFLVLLGSWVLGTFGFSQMIAVIKYPQLVKNKFFTFLLWLIILGLGAFVVLMWLNSYYLALIIGYGVSFVMSLRVKPD